MTQSDEERGECPAPLMARVIEVMQGDDAAGLNHVEGLLADYPADARLHFLRGSLMAALRRYDEAREAMGTAIEVAPGYAIARFQLGFLELTSGNVEAALSVWRPLQALPADNYLKVLAEGLDLFSRDDFPLAFEILEKGMALNTDNLFVNRDMQLLIDTTRRKLAENAASEEPTSATHLLLQQYKVEPTKH